MVDRRPEIRRNFVRYYSDVKHDFSPRRNRDSKENTEVENDSMYPPHTNESTIIIALPAAYFNPHPSPVPGEGMKSLPEMQESDAMQGILCSPLYIDLIIILFPSAFFLVSFILFP
jgi:hypothetical protein